MDVKDVKLPPVVWDWKSSAERWRWSICQPAEKGMPILVEVEKDGESDEVPEVRDPSS